MFEAAISRCEDFVEVIEVISDMFSKLMHHVYSMTSDLFDASESSRDGRSLGGFGKGGRNIHETVKTYEQEIKQLTRVVVEQKNYIQILENRIKDKDSIYLQVSMENKVFIPIITRN